jgi:hypothetical protein
MGAHGRPGSTLVDTRLGIPRLPQEGAGLLDAAGHEVKRQGEHHDQ